MISTKSAAVTIALAALASIAASGWAMTWYAATPDTAAMTELLVSWWSLWILGPGLFALVLAWRAAGRFRSIATLAILLLALGFGPAVYLYTAYASSDAQDALVFIFAPLWQWVGLGLAVLLGFVLPRFTGPPDAAP